MIYSQKPYTSHRKKDIEKKEDNTSVFSQFPEDKEHILSPFTDFWPYRWGTHSQRDRFSTMIRTIIYADALSAHFFFFSSKHSLFCC